MSQKRLELEAAATEAVQRSGFHNLSFRTLANQVGVKSSSVHYYFPEKSSLAGALIKNYTDAFAEALAQIDNQNETLAEKLKAFIDIFETVIQADKFCLCGMMAAEVAILDEQNRKLLSNYFLQSEQWLATKLAEHSDSLTVDLEPQQLSRVIMSGLEGAILIDRVDNDNERLTAQRQLILSFLK